MNSRFEYVMKNFKLYYQLDNIKVCYGCESEDGLVIIKQHAEEDFFTLKKELNFEKVVWKEWKGVSIPFCFEENGNAEIFAVQGNQVIINYDIIASSFYFLSGWNEYVNPSKDELGRASYEFSVIKALNIPFLPVVNYYFDILYESLLKIKGVVRRTLWQNQSFAVNLTHDIDTCKTGWIEGIRSEFRQKKYFSIPKLIVNHFLGKDDWFNFQLISSIDKQFASASTFFFLAKRGKVGKYYNADYDIAAVEVQNAIKSLIEQGHEIGIHGSFGTHLSAPELVKDIQKINANSIIGGRFHFLMFDPEKTVSILEENDIRYDTSLGFPEYIGFRRSFCHPFYLYDFKNNRSAEVLEIPLNIMDVTLPRYMGVTGEDALKQMILLITETKKHGGVLTILWHNNFFSDYTGWRGIYIKILEYCRYNNALITNGKDIYSRITGR